MILSGIHALNYSIDNAIGEFSSILHRRILLDVAQNKRVEIDTSHTIETIEVIEHGATTIYFLKAIDITS